MHSLEDFGCLGIDVVQLFVTNLLKILTQAVHSLVTRDEPHTTSGTTTKPSVRSAELLSLFVNGLFCYILDHQLWYAKLVSSLTLATGANTHLRCLQICSSCDWCFLSTICVSFTQKCFATQNVHVYEELDLFIGILVKYFPHCTAAANKVLHW